MSNSQISTFDFKSHSVRVELFKNEPHFCLTDVCTALDISNANSSRFKFNEAGVHKMYISFPSGKKEVTFINEPNLYRIIFRSNKANAVEFQNWVFEEVLPQIRKTGQYQAQQQLALPEPEKKYTVELTEDELLDLAWAWYAFIRGIHTFRHIYPAFEKLGSNMSGAIYGQGFEYCQTARQAHKVISRLTQDLEYHFDSNHRVLEHVRNFDPTFEKSVR